MNIYEKLSHIQNEMKVPKNLFNKFGNYNYRNAESILEAAKPICLKYRTTLKIDDAIEFKEGRFYVKSVAYLFDWDSDKWISNVAYARESEKKTGMDDAQLTGSCSSYARKYCLNGLFNLDDTKDADTEEMKNETDNRAKAQKTTQATTQHQTDQKVILATANQISLVKNLYSANELKQMLERLHKKDIAELTVQEASTMIQSRGGNK